MFTEYALNALLKQTYARTPTVVVDCALFALSLPPHLALHTRAHPASIYHEGTDVNSSP